MEGILIRKISLLLVILGFVGCAKGPESSVESSSFQNYIVVLNKDHIASMALKAQQQGVSVNSAKIVTEALDEMDKDYIGFRKVMWPISH
jgi:hypothetical protein